MYAVESQINCGAKLFVVEIPYVHSVAMGVLVNVGTRDEIWPKEAGLAHAYEHMVFRGNAKFPASNLLTGYLEKIGGAVNAWTDKEATFYYNLIPADYAERGVEYLCELVTTPLFNAEHISPEMNNVVGEIKSRNDTPEELAQDLSDEVIYGKHPLGQSVLGTIESVTGFTREDFLHWQKKFYYSKNFTFVVVGNISPDKALRIFNQFFQNFSSKEKNSRTKNFFCEPTKNQLIVSKGIEQLHILLAVPVADSTKNEKATRALELFQYMIDGGMSFPLFQEVREKYGLGYSAEAGFEFWSDLCSFKVYAGVEAESYKTALSTIFRVIKKSYSNKRLFGEAKELLLGGTAIRYESTGKILDKLAHDIAIGGRPKLIEETLEEIKKVELEEVVAAVEKYLKPENFVQILIAPNGFSV